MKKATKLAALLLAAAMVLSLCSCGSTKTSVYKIGATGPLTGGASSYGNSVNNGARLAIDEINAAGGLNGVKFEFDMKDDQATADDAASGYDALMDWGMQISLGSVTSGSCAAFAKRSLSDNVFFITPSASAANVIETGANAFRVCFGDPDQGILAARELAGKYTNIGVIYDESDDYSAGIFEAFEGEMATLGASYTTRTFDADNKKDFSAQVEALKDCDVIFLPIYYTEAALIARTCTSKQLDDIVLFGCDGLDGVAALLDESVKNVVSYITPFDAAATTGVSGSFIAAYQAKYNATPDQFAADGYDAVYTIYNAMKAAGVNDPSIKASDLCEKVKAAITASSFSYEGATGTMTWDASGACNKTPIIVVIGE